MVHENTLWPGWETVRLIGKGGFGSVFEIQRTIFDNTEKAALKVITIPQSPSEIDELFGDGYDRESIVNIFAQHLKDIVGEYSMMRKMNSCNNIVSCDDVRYEQHEDGIGWDIYIKMELLTPLLTAFPHTTSEQVILKAGKDLCNALVMCKHYNVIHRDIKPQNIFVSDTGDFKLGDFGIAKVSEKTMGGTKIGTYKYMAPEIYNNQHYGAVADIYSLGLVLYWMLNEHRMPFLPLPPIVPSFTDEEQAKLHRFRGEKLPVPKHGSPALQAVVLKACAFHPADRFESAVQMLEALEAAENTISSASTTEDFEKTEWVRPIASQSDTDATVRVRQSLQYIDDTVRETPTKQSEPNSNVSPTDSKGKDAPKRAWVMPLICLLAVVAIVVGLVSFPKFLSRQQDSSISQQELVDVYLTTAYLYFEDGVEISREEYQYNDNGNMTVEIHFENGVEVGYYEHRYDSSGNKTAICLTAGNETLRYIYQYDNGKISAEIEQENGVEIYRLIYQYNNDGKIATKIRQEEGVEVWRCEYQYDGNGNKITDIWFYDDQESERYEYQYDYNGNMIAEIGFKDGIEITRWEYQYDSDGKLVTEFYWEDGIKLAHNEFLYDSNGNKIAWIWLNQHGKEEGRYEYQYKKMNLPRETAEKLQANYCEEFRVDFVTIKEQA